MFRRTLSTQFVTFASAAALSSLASVGCDPFGSHEALTAGSGGQGAGSGGATSAQTGSGGATSTGSGMCVGAETLCGSSCVDLQTDAANCGTCGKACSFNEACEGGECSRIPCRALKFDGKDDFVSVPASVDFAYGSAFTVEWWMKAAAGVDYPRILAHEATSGAPNSLYTSWSVDGVNKLGQVRFQTALSSEFETSTTLVKQGAWAHVAAVITNGTDITLYFNGAQSGMGTASFSGDTTNVVLGIGADLKHLTDYPFSGSIGPLRISKKARYTNAFSPAWGWEADADTVAVWNMFEGAGASLLDQSGGKHDGAIVGPVWESLATCPTGGAR